MAFVLLLIPIVCYLHKTLPHPGVPWDERQERGAWAAPPRAHSPALMLRDHLRVHLVKREQGWSREKSAWECPAGPSGSLPFPDRHAPRAA